MTPTAGPPVGPPSSPPWLREHPEPLTARFDLLLLDLDGTVYVGAEAVTGAAAAVEEARKQGQVIAYVTNNASRTPAAVAAHLRRLGLPAGPHDVVTSSQAAAGWLRASLPAAARVLVVGGEGLRDALEEVGLVPVASADDDPAAVAQGFAPEVGWHQLAEASYALARGLPWVATNADLTLPTERGLAPGNGSLVALLASVVGAEPVVTGKPQAPLLTTAVTRFGARAPLVVGDRLDTDVAGAAAAGLPSLLVLTGVCDPAALLRARPAERPTYLARDLAGLHRPHPGVGREGGWWRCAARRARVEGARLLLAGDAAPSSEADGLDGLRAACAALWEHRDRADGARRPAVARDEPGEEVRDAAAVPGDEVDVSAVLDDLGALAG